MPWNKDDFTGRPGKFDVQGHGMIGCGRAFVVADCCLADLPWCGDMPADPNVPWPIGGHSRCRCGAVSGHIVSWRARVSWHQAHKRAVQAQAATDAWRAQCHERDMGRAL
jgi:hypothetical protein